MTTRLAMLAALCLTALAMATEPLPLWQRLAHGRPDASAPVAAATRPGADYVRCEVLVAASPERAGGLNYERDGQAYRIAPANPTAAEVQAARQAAYVAAGLTPEAMARCALEAVASGNTAAALAMLAKLTAIDAAHPMPAVE